MEHAATGHEIQGLIPVIQGFFENSILLSLGLLLIVGYALAKLASKLGLPEVTGFIIAGILLGDSVIGLVPHEMSRDLSLVTEFALGMIALTIGAEFYWVKLKTMGRGVVIITLIQLVAAFSATALGLWLFGMDLPPALLLGAIATATAPAATVAIVQGLNASGKFVDYLYGVVALDDAGAVILFGVVFAIVSSVAGPAAGGTLAIIGTAVFEVLASVLFGAVSGLLIHILVRRRRKSKEILLVSLGVILLTIGAANSLHLSPLLTNMAAGAVIINLSARNHRIFHILEPLTPPIYALFFVLAGTELNLSVLTDPALLILGVVYIAFRSVGKYGGVYIGAKMARSDSGITRYLGLCMLPQAGVAIGLTLLIQSSEYGRFLMETNPRLIFEITNIVLISVFFNELVGPPISKFALLKGLEKEA